MVDRGTGDVWTGLRLRKMLPEDPLRVPVEILRVKDPAAGLPISAAKPSASPRTGTARSP